MQHTVPIEGGGVTSAEGFSAGSTLAGIKSYGPEPRFDLALLLSDRRCSVAGLLTQNLVPGAPVQLCRERLETARSRGVVVNSGCSNVATGEPGLADARRMAELSAARVGVASEELLVASTGVIGRRLPMDLIEAGLGRITPARSGGSDFARAIMTTDTVPKSRAVRVTLSSGGSIVIGGAAKGSGMVHPDMATVLCFLTTDAAAKPDWLKSVLKAAADDSLNMLDVDMDTSTSDTMLLFANGAATQEPLEAGHPDAERFSSALRGLCIDLARDLARDGEGASTLIEVRVQGATDVRDARLAASNSSIKAAITSSSGIFSGAKRADRLAIVGDSKMARMSISHPNRCRTRETICVARSEWPPN
jgi:glutamate N-acetyltransferase/amino-acid N-acetyltransferase